ncbi:hypothetical protein, partial [Muriicola sp.]|uniref:hypothetical protein n=1 Tax=Muriicola sp. TaxID=2020856 RepID=UPI003C71B286
FYIESIGLIFIVLSPFIFKIHQYLPSDPDKTIDFLGMTFDSNGFKNLRAYSWFLLSKLIPLYLLIIWFFTCKHWWYHILLIPLCMYAFQLFEVIYSEDSTIDTENVLWLLPICMVVIPFVYFVRLKLYDKYVHGIDLEAMDLELQFYKEKEKQKNSKYQVQEDLPIEEEADLSEKVTNKTLSKLFRQFQHSLKNLFNFML